MLSFCVQRKTLILAWMHGELFKAQNLKQDSTLVNSLSLCLTVQTVPSLNTGLKYDGADFSECHPSLAQILTEVCFLSQPCTFLPLTRTTVLQNRHQNDCQATETRLLQTRNRKETDIVQPHLKQWCRIPINKLTWCSWWVCISCSLSFPKCPFK